MSHDEPDLRHPHGWTGEERRGIDGVTLKLMTEVRVAMENHEKKEESKFTELKAEIRENREESDVRHAEVLNRFNNMQSSTMTLLQTNNNTTNEIHKMFKQAFPEGDVQAHRKAHEAWIEKDKADKDFWVKLKLEVVKWGLLAGAGWAGIALWAAFVQGPK
jgi:thiamine phosphate synthase YjbQ (UPF0047 family)